MILNQLAKRLTFAKPMSGVQTQTLRWTRGVIISIVDATHVTLQIDGNATTLTATTDASGIFTVGDVVEVLVGSNRLMVIGTATAPTPPVDSGWTAPTLTNSWASWVETPDYRKQGNRVSLRGGVTGGTANTSAFTLPAGFRPPQQCIFNQGGNAITIATSGTVTIFASQITYLDAIYFTID